MPTLSTPIGELKAEYGVVVVGSGYGGAIAAYRMAEYAKRAGNGQPAFSVALFERGPERQAGEFPTTFAGALQQIQADSAMGRLGSRTGLFDFRMNRDVSVLVGCGLGGTSLINAGVMLRPAPAVFKDPRWPAALRGTGVIEQYFPDVTKILDVHECPPDVVLEKVQWLSKAAQSLKLTVTPAPVAISFSTHLNAFDVQQQRCVLCGSCITGCNHSAKNTVATNYLPGAANAGSAVFCEIDTRAVEKDANGDWLVHVRFNDAALRPFGPPDIIIRAKMVFLAAGTLGSTEILLRSRSRYGLPVSNQLGRRFTGNGDVIAFGYNTPDRANGFGYGGFIPRNASVGPTIAALIDEPSKPSGMMIQEGAIPGALRFPLRFGAPVMARVTHRVGDVAFDFRLRHLWRELDSMIRGVRHGALARTQTFLAMGVDDGKGMMALSRDRLRITWDQAGYQAVYRTIAARLQELTKAMKGRYVINPFWSRFFGRRLMTVHPLGGCCIGDDAEEAVVNEIGQVFDGSDPAGKRPHQGLYVCDGSIVPRPLGTNPALTISALAEHIARTATGNSLLKAAAPFGTWPSRVNRALPGIRYAERMRGRMWLDDLETRFEFILHMSAESVEELINQRDHKLRLIGTAHSPDLPAGRRQWTISDGTLNVLIDDPRTVDTKLLVYRFKMTNEAGNRVVWVRGHKIVNLHTLRSHPWLALTRIPFEIYEKDPAESRAAADLCASAEVPEKRPALDVLESVEAWDSTRSAQALSASGGVRPPHRVGAGVVRSSVIDAMRMVLSVTVIYERNVMRRLRWKWRYGWYFLKTVVQLRVWAIRTTRRINPFDAEDLKTFRVNPKTLEEPIADRKQPDSPRFTVTRYVGTSQAKATLGPVILAPGFGMSTLAFHAAGADSFAEHLRREGYDVWLLDYRASDRLSASLSPFDVDQLAQCDFPDAIDTVYCETRGQKVRVVAHCLASMTMQMGLLSGKIPTARVHSMVLSQSFAFLDLPWVTRFKVRLHLPELLAYFNFRVVTSDYDVRSSFGERLLDRLLYFFPSNERCYEGVCRRLLLLYGEVVRHDKLDQKTHETFYHLFDRGNLAAFKHIGRMFILGRIADKDGNDVYLRPEHGPRVTIPITLLQGTANNMFLPSGARKTHAWLVKHGGFGDHNKDMFTLVESPGYGHLDSFIGQNAARDVFPQIIGALRTMQPRVPD